MPSSKKIFLIVDVGKLLTVVVLCSPKLKKTAEEHKDNGR